MVKDGTLRLFHETGQVDMHGTVNYKFLAEAGFVHSKASMIAAMFRLCIQGETVFIMILNYT
jgi:hypothetical protein